jgi:carbon storage regulator CsrA
MIEIEKGVSIMLILERKNQQAVVVSDPRSSKQLLKVTVLEIRRGGVKLGIEGEREVPVYRSEVWETNFTREQPRPSAPGERSARVSRRRGARKAVFAR